MKSIYLDTVRLQRFIDSVYADALMGLNLSPIEAHILATLHEQGAMMASELARSVGRVATSFTPTLDHLQERELVQRQAHATDRRALQVCLTDAGKALFPALADVLAKAHETAAAAFTDEHHPAFKFVDTYRVEEQPY